MKNVVIYVRVSTKEQLQNGSLATQLRKCKEYASYHGYDIIKIYTEEGESAKTADRTELQNMLSYLARHKSEIDGLLVYSIDRFSRNLEDFFTLCSTLQELRIKLVAVTQETDDSPEGHSCVIFTLYLLNTTMTSVLVAR